MPLIRLEVSAVEREAPREMSPTPRILLVGKFIMLTDDLGSKRRAQRAAGENKRCYAREREGVT